MEFKICPDLLCEYIRLIAMMEQARGISTVDLYEKIDIRRGEVHDQILAQVGRKRGDRDVETFLSQIVEMYLRKAVKEGE